MILSVKGIYGYVLHRTICVYVIVVVDGCGPMYRVSFLCVAHGNAKRPTGKDPTRIGEGTINGLERNVQSIPQIIRTFSRKINIQGIKYRWALYVYISG